MSLPLSPLTIVGFGSQAKAWALNLKDSKKKVFIALHKKSPSRALALKLGFEVVQLESHDLGQSRIFILLIPDNQHLNFLELNQSYIKKGSYFFYAHGFSLTKENIIDRFPQFVHSLLAPKAIASDVRYQYETNGKIGAVFFAPDLSAEKILKDIAKSVGFTALYKGHFEEETTADLFSEQSLLCSLLPYVALKSYNLLRKNGISQEVAFMECFLELKSISQAFVTMGPIEFFKLISPNALIGSQKGKKLLLDQHFDKNLETLLRDIVEKKFYEESEVDCKLIQEKVLTEWQNEELTHVFKKLKNELIN